MQKVKLFVVFLISISLAACSSSPPDDIVEESISDSYVDRFLFHGYELNDWSETNSYEREINGENVYFVEYEAELELREDQKKYLHSDGAGKPQYHEEFKTVTGEFAFVQRGSKWYRLR